MREPSPTPMFRMREENFSGGGSMCGSLLLVSEISSMSKKMAPGMCSVRYSARASLPSSGMCQEASMMTRSGASSSRASSSVSVNHVLVCSKSKSPVFSLNERVRGRGPFAVEPLRHRQPLLTQEFGVEQPALVAGAVIGEHRDDRMTGAEIAGEPDGAGDIDAARSAEAETFLTQEVENDRQRLGILDLVGLVDLGGFEILSDAALADPFGDGAAFGLQLAVLVVTVERGAHRVGKPDHDAGVVRLEPHRHAGKSAAGADGADEAVDFAVKVAPDLLGRGFDVTLAI